MWPFNDIGRALGGRLAELAASAFEGAMRMLWDGSLALLRAAFSLADRFSVFVVDVHSGPVGALWPMMLWISGVLALGLFFWQLTMTSLRGGRGFLRLATGPMQYGIALAVTTGLVGTFLVAADGLTEGILNQGLQSANFQEALHHTGFADGAVDGVKAVVLGICAVIGVVPAAIGYCLEMLFREAAVYLLVATIPITAAGLLANVSKSWFWKTARWLLACIAMKPVLALALALGVALVGGSQGLSGLLAGIGVLVVSVFTPFVLFRLFAFVDPNTDAGGAFRDALSSAGMDSYGSGNPAMQAADALTGVGGGSGGGSDSGGGSAQEDAHSGRFDAAVADYGNQEMDTYGIGNGSGSSFGDSSSDDSSQPGEGEQNSDDAEDAQPPAANRGSVTSSDGVGPQHSDGSGSSGGEEPPPPEPPDHGGQEPPDDSGGPRGGGGGSGPKTSGGGGAGASSSEAAEAAVIV